MNRLIDVLATIAIATLLVGIVASIITNYRNGNKP